MYLTLKTTKRRPADQLGVFVFNFCTCQYRYFVIFTVFTADHAE